MSNVGSKRPARDPNPHNWSTNTKKNDPSDTTMGNLWEHHLSTEDKKELTKAFGEYCREKNMTMKDLFLKCSDEERTQAWPLIVSNLSIELVTKMDLIMQEIQKDRGKPRNNATAATRMPTLATTTAGITTTSATTPPATPTNTNTINVTALASPTCAATTAAAPLNPTNDMMFAGLFGLTDAEIRQETREGPTKNTTKGADSREEQRIPTCISG
jgi:hypothetical protein